MDLGIIVLGSCVLGGNSPQQWVAHYTVCIAPNGASLNSGGFVGGGRNNPRNAVAAVCHLDRVKVTNFTTAVAAHGGVVQGFAG